MTHPDRSASLLPATTALLERIRTKDYRIGIVGLGYVGIPLALAAVRAGFPVLGFDIDAERVGQLARGISSIKQYRDFPAIRQSSIGFGLYGST